MLINKNIPINIALKYGLWMKNWTKRFAYLIFCGGFQCDAATEILKFPSIV